MYGVGWPTTSAGNRGRGSDVIANATSQQLSCHAVRTRQATFVLHQQIDQPPFRELADVAQWDVVMVRCIVQHNDHFVVRILRLERRDHLLIKPMAKVLTVHAVVIIACVGCTNEQVLCRKLPFTELPLLQCLP